ncbi:hypothetical protein [Orbus mooreae]|uniref:hypothetical protein n=1 Tax=Orbus mooreae TaxID=3074107 RepID=UPI00370D6EAD
MKDMSKNKTLKCIRSHCENKIYIQSKLAKQLGLCLHHFTLHSEQYFHCDYCHLLSKRKKSTINNYCSNRCRRLDYIPKQKWFKILNADINRISTNIQDDKIRNSFFYSLTTTSLIKDIQFLYELKNGQQNIMRFVERLFKKSFETVEYVSVLDVSICHHSTITIGALHFIAPTKITNKIEKNNFLLEMIKANGQESLRLFNYLDSIFSIPCSNKNLEDKSDDLNKFVFFFSKEEPYNHYPILKLLDYYLYGLVDDNDSDILKNAQINQLSTCIAEIKRTNDINPLYVELFSLILLYSLVFRDDNEVIFIELSELLNDVDNNKLETKISIFLPKWFDFKLPSITNNKREYYLKFYQSLFLVYKQKMPNMNAST